ncbi:helix-turn-helix domain-containing protein [Kineosporia sp. J2-2]|uniref:Helix-turn-helix domain-containing protein n=1 Tax=Kineosporia corallincola TaxID=2835133 RepID=A0ABS5TTZ7_9ACTN|nr:helix-turn-helix transcriptional regulator [Kineosporia corallincola]MBT0774281.1 helix-turn-helix domain-containing protein [Kineosporia corallincola]
MTAVTLAQRQLARRLRVARERAKKTQGDAAVGLDCDESKIYRIETCRSQAKVADVRSLATLYALDRRQTDDLERLARGAKVRGWTEPYLDLVPSTLSMLGDLETSAVGIDAYCTEVLHGLLQTPAYAAHIIGLTELPPEQKRSLLDFRLARQRSVFGRSDFPHLRFVVHAAALRAQPGPPELMQEQIRDLRSLAADGKAEISVWSEELGVHPWMSGAFSIHVFEAELGEGEAPVVFTENLAEGRYLETEPELTKFRLAFDRIHARAIPIREFA